MTSLIAVSAFSGGVYGITGNFQADTTPYVCVVVLFGDSSQTNPLSYCSGVLISPTVVLTAGHSTLNAVSASVCFDKGPIGYTFDDGKIVYSGSEPIYNGKPITFPDYEKAINSELPKGSHLFANSDVGLIILNDPIPGIETAKLPSAGFADTLAEKTYLKVIGYGAQIQVTPRNSGVEHSWTGTISCNSALTQLTPGTFVGSEKYLRLTANPSQDKGGIAFGDSGGPVLYQGKDDTTCTVLAINAFVSSSNCAGVSYHTRIDTKQVLDWIQASGAQVP